MGVPHLTCHSTWCQCPVTRTTDLHSPAVAPSQPAQSFLTVAMGLCPRATQLQGADGTPLDIQL